MKCIAIDDEALALEIIKNFCQRLNDTEIELQTYTNPIEGLEQVKRQKPDILLLDVEMGDVCGVDIAKGIPSQTSLIFTTAFAEYAVDGFDLNAVDFLHKPFSFTRFEKAIRKAAELRKLQQQNLPATPEDEYISVKSEYRTVTIRYTDILYIESMGNYVKIYYPDAPYTLSQISMKSLQEQLPADMFLRVHKSFIVPRHRIAHFSKKDITLYNNQTIPVGRSYAKSLEALTDV